MLLLGKRFEGTMRQGALHEGVYVWPNGQRYDGTYKNSKNTRDGKHAASARTSLSPTLLLLGAGQLSTGQADQSPAYEGGWRDGKPHGEGSFTDSKGKCAIGEWQNGQFLGDVKDDWAT